MKKILIALAGSLFVSSIALAQKEYSDFTSTGRAGVSTTFSRDYQSVGINPANLGWNPQFKGDHVTFSLLEFAGSVHSTALTRPDMYDAITHFNTQKLTYQQKEEAAQSFINSPTAINLDALELGVAVQLPKIGGIGFTVQDRFQWYSTFNKQMSDILFRGYNADYFNLKYDQYGNLTNDPALVVDGASTNPEKFSQLFNNSQVDFTWDRTYNLAYGRKFVNGDNFKLFGGVGLKYVQGNAIIEMNSENGVLTAFSAVSPDFNINYGDSVANKNPSTIQKKNTILPPTAVGNGFGLDLGISMLIKTKLTIGLAVTDIGSVTYDGNVYQALDTKVLSTQSDGFNSYDFIKEAQDIVSDNGYFQWKGEKKKTVNLPTVARAGVSYKFLKDLVEAGVDAVFPVNEDNGNLEKPVVSVGGDIFPHKAVTLSTGFTFGGNNGFAIPIGVVFRVGPKKHWELGIASRDIVTYLTQKKPTLSLAFGFLRFRL